LFGFGLYAFTGEQPLTTPASTGGRRRDGTATVETPTSTATSTAPAAIPSTTPPPARPGPVAQHGQFHQGAWVRVVGGAGDCLNARAQPSLSAETHGVNVCLPDGFEGYVASTGAEQDGHWWWMLAGAGWVAEDYLLYLRDVSLREAAASPGGRIAFRGVRHLGDERRRQRSALVAAGDRVCGWREPGVVA
jgi:hypothetical protein